MKYCRKVWLLLVFLGIFSFLNQAVAGQEKIAITHGPYLVDLTENAVTIVWFTNKKCVSWVECGTGENLRSFPTYGSVVQTAKSSRHGLIDAYTNIHRIRITGLRPGQKYRYRIFSGEILQFRPYEVTFGDSIVGEIYQFETFNANKPSFSFGVVSDVHERSAKLDTLLQNVSWDAVDMVFFNGDMLDWFEREEQLFEGFIDVSVDRFAARIPIVYTRGNHETRGFFARNLFDYFPHSSGRFYYSFNHGNVHFIVMDTGEDKTDEHPVYAGLTDFDVYREEQAEWLKTDVESEEFKNALFRVVVFHMPPNENARGYGEQHLGKVWGPVLNDAGIDLLICGHKHRFSVVEPGESGNTYPVLIAGTNMFIRCDVSPGQLLVTVAEIDGRVRDSFVLKAKKR